MRASTPEIKPFRTLPDIVGYYADSASSTVALEYRQQRVTYGELANQAGFFAEGLRKRGVGTGDRVAYLGRNSNLYFILLYACAFRGAIFVPLNWRLTSGEIDEIVRDSAPRVIFYDRDFGDKVGGLKDGTTELLPFSLDAGGAHDLGHMLPGSAAPPVPDVKSEDVAVLLYTSGTTGHAKGVKLSHRALIAPRETELGVGDWTHWQSGDDKLVAVMPLFHVACLSSAMMAFYHGCTVFSLDQADPELVLEAIGERRLTQGCIVPTVLSAMLKSPRLASTDLSSLRTLTYGGSPIAAETLVQLLDRFRCNFAQGYGMTEVGGACMFLQPEHHNVDLPHRLRSIGTPGPSARLEVRNAHGEKVGDDEIGEIWLDAVGIMTGYWNRPDEDETVMRGRWYRSGDAGYRDKDGFFYLTDRIKDMIVSGGENVYPAEVERAMSAHPGLLEIAVIGIPDNKWGEAVHAIAVCKPGVEITAAELISFARERLAGFKIPKAVEFMASLPRNAFGKIAKPLLREPYWVGRSRRIN